MDIDFVELYRELGVPLDCSQEGLTLAYRRRVAELHPDRHHGDPAGAARLLRLNQLYQAAIAFSREHGRLPGVQPRPPPVPPPPAIVPLAPDPDAPRHGRRAPPGTRAVPWLVVLAAASLLLPGTDRPLPASPGQDRGSGPAGGTDGDGAIGPGSTHKEVLDVEGPPADGDDVLWEYGPSWVRFHCGRVVAWHSSASRPLHLDHGTPLDGEATGEPHARECGDTGGD